ncbi:hypothetical protein [Nocardioides sp.]|uniref:hypothetical protein n=1 Tax=Nocardioides sp. TaxID=35761 RepID=UPI00262CCCF0|nr:hypothetical protein [Nocardioides sp.]
MPTARSSTEPRPHRHHPVTEAVRAVADVGTLVRFRAAHVRRPRAFRAGLVLFALGSLAVAMVPSLVPGAGEGDRARDVLIVLPTALAALVLVSVVAAVASGGGRELLARDPASIHPVSPTTDHLGALVLAPLNVAWLLQSWSLLGAAAYGTGWGWALLAMQVAMLLWLVLATALGQVVAWTLEGLRRLRFGEVALRVATVASVAAVLVLQLRGDLVPLLDQVPTVRVVATSVGGPSWAWAGLVGTLAGLALAAVVLGAVPAHLATRRVPHDELRVESGSYRARRLPRTDLAVLVRTDRASVWRAVPMRRGLAVLAVGPGVIALLGALPWAQLIILPGLVASGGALLFGVNAWCLDGRGGLWRESLPVGPGTVFAARAWVLAEFLLVASLVTVVLGALRAGVPTASEVTALVAMLAVVTVQVVAAAMRWSLAHPYAVDLRSARATPAPPLMMVGYSSRLALSTTLTGLVFSALARLDDPLAAVLVAVPFLCWSGLRLARAHTRWTTPTERARVVVTTAA